MSYSGDITKWEKFAREGGLKKSVYASPLDLAFRRFGYKCPPSIFWKYYVVIFVSALPFSISWGIFMYFFALPSRSLAESFYVSVLAGILFSLPIAWIQARTKKKLKLTTWDNFTKN